MKNPYVCQVTYSLYVTLTLRLTQSLDYLSSKEVLSTKDIKIKANYIKTQALAKKELVSKASFYHSVDAQEPIETTKTIALLLSSIKQLYLQYPLAFSCPSKKVSECETKIDFLNFLVSTQEGVPDSAYSLKLLTWCD